MIFSCALCWKQNLNISRNKIKFLKLAHVNRNVCLYAPAWGSQNSGHCQNKTRVQAGDLNARFVCVDISVEDIDDFIDHFFSGFVGGVKHMPLPSTMALPPSTSTFPAFPAPSQIA